jgi:putative tryptophan/tyrosine transport system substrate-binding protein
MANKLSSRLCGGATHRSVPTFVNERTVTCPIAMLAQRGADALIVSPDPFLDSHRETLVSLTARYAVPAIFQWREFVQAGGLVSYGTSLADAHRQLGNYTGKILQGATPADLPVVQPTRFELFINLKTAQALRLNVPTSILLRADEVIE